MRKRIASYRTGTRFTIEAAKLTDAKRLLPKGRTIFRPRPSDRIVNWGCSSAPWPGDSEFTYSSLNPFQAVNKASNKLTTFMNLSDKGIPTLDWTLNKEIAHKWLSDDNRVYCRLSLRGQGGDGIVVVEPEGELCSAPLYTKGERKFKEYRVHVLVNEVLVAQKRRREGSDSSFRVRNASNGFVFCLSKVDPYPIELHDIPTKAVHSLGLDFGAVDVLVLPDGCIKIIEVNTAPLLEGTSMKKYLNMVVFYLRHGKAGEEDEDGDEELEYLDYEEEEEL